MLENKTKVPRKNIICWRANRFHKRSVTGEMNQVEVNGTEEQKKTTFPRIQHQVGSSSSSA